MSKLLFPTPFRRMHCFWLVIGWLLLLAQPAHAALPELQGRWYQAPAGWQYRGQPDLAPAGLPQAAHPQPTGGNFWYQADIHVPHDGRYVIDFRNSSTIGRFRHWVFDRQGRRLALLEGGIQSDAPNPFLLRHGREIDLAAGDYRLVSQLESPFFLAQPEPYLDTLDDYRQSIKPGNILVLACLGIFVGLGFYYAALSLVRRRLAERMYTAFILGNLLYNGSSLLLFPDLFGMHWFLLVSVPILFSNCAYIVFVMALLEIRKQDHPRLYRAGLASLGLLGAAMLVGLLRPNWSLEMDRYGVGLFMSYGLAAGVIRARAGNRSARWYLVAIGTFFMLGLAAISLGRTDADTLYVEHIGLLAVAVEVVLLALVLAYQFAQLNRERESALDDARRSTSMAQTDILTGLPNRLRLQQELAALPASGSLTIIDLDGLKYYNDTYGHARGDTLLCGFARHLRMALAGHALLHRIGGDEFAVTCAGGDVDRIRQALEAALAALRDEGFGFIGASAGSAHVAEIDDRQLLQHLADTRMYQQKQRRDASPRRTPGGPVAGAAG